LFFFWNDAPFWLDNSQLFELYRPICRYNKSYDIQQLTISDNHFRRTHYRCNIGKKFACNIIQISLFLSLSLALALSLIHSLLRCSSVSFTRLFRPMRRREENTYHNLIAPTLFFNGTPGSPIKVRSCRAKQATSYPGCFRPASRRAGR